MCEQGASPGAAGGAYSAREDELELLHASALANRALTAVRRADERAGAPEQQGARAELLRAGVEDADAALELATGDAGDERRSEVAQIALYSRARARRGMGGRDALRRSGRRWLVRRRWRRRC